MKMITYVTIGALILILFIGLNACKGKNKENQSIDVKKTELTDNPYLKLREQAINVTPEQLNLELEHGNDIYGIVMDWNMGDAIVSVVSFKTGDASVYMSTGQAFIGGYSHETVINAAKQFVNAGSNYLTKSTKTDSTEPTKGNKVGFYFLTKSGKYYVEENFENIENNNSDFLKLFEAGNLVITEYRIVTEEK